MVEHTRRRRYQYDRVLIESGRILTPQFDDAVIHLSGAQLEMLRNVSQYLRNLSTYVSEYQPGYYLTPDVSDYDDILEIVADLEETLMGNLNTIWGYKDTYGDANNHTVSGTGTRTLYFGTVPSGEVWRIEGLTAHNDTTICTKIMFWAASPGPNIIVHEKTNPPAGERELWKGVLTLRAGNNFWVQFYGCQDGDYISTTARGYKMDVPE